MNLRYLTDLKYPDNGVREYQTRKQKWVIVIQGKVGIALNEEWAAKWRESGAATRCMAISIRYQTKGGKNDGS